MAKIGYMLLAPRYVDSEGDKVWMEKFGCYDIIQEEYPDNEKSREQWDGLLARIQPGDTLVIPKLSNALKSARQLVFFLEFCRIQNVRLVSIHDKIDSGDELFPETKTSDVLTAIALLPKEANAVRVPSKPFQRMRRKIKAMSKKQLGRAERNRRIINMYREGFSIDDIIDQSGFKSRSSVFRILNDAGVDLNRGRTKGPLGPRKKKDNPGEY
ncbi:MAG: recombinase family protein [Muribaculaceae bacterium]|nr:recombinase family protein [Muribaculaceae bacterium]